MSITKQIISYTQYTDKGWKIRIRQGNTMSIIKGGKKFGYSKLSMSSKKELVPLIRFIQKDLNHDFKLIEEELEE